MLNKTFTQFGLLLLVTTSGLLFSEECAPNTSHQQEIKQVQPFSGKVIGNKVRLRLTPDLDSHVVTEANKGDVFAIVAETDEYFAIKPGKGIKAYIYRTYVLNNTVEGQHVNVRLAPALEAPIISQLNTGDQVNGNVLTKDHKWLEVDLPKNAYFWIAKDYVENMGSIEKLEQYERRKHEASELLRTALLLSQSEMQKPFKEVAIERLISNFEKIITQYSEFESESAKAKEFIGSIQKLYAEKNITYLEQKAGLATKELEALKIQKEIPIAAQNEGVCSLTTTEDLKEKDLSDALSDVMTLSLNTNYTDKMKVWLPIEQNYFQKWSQDRLNVTLEDFYNEQKSNAITVTGVVEPFNYFVKSKPGDYMLKKSDNQIGYLYSTHIDLQDYIGKEVTLVVFERDNHMFAFPAYYVLSTK